MNSDYVWIASHEALEAALPAWQAAQELALDTEFIRTHTFYPQPALLQIADDQQIYLLDLLALDQAPSRAALASLLASGPTKIFHSAGEDLELLHHWLNVRVAPFIDTQLASALITQEMSVGYQRLVETYLDIQLEKGETRSDWLQRPLTPSQCHYAAQDVEYLLACWHALAAQLSVQQREILEQESAYQAQAACEREATPWLRLKQNWRLTPRQLTVIQALAVWREEQARRLDRPRSRIASDSLLHDLAEQGPSSLVQLGQISEASPGWVKRFGAEVLSVIAESQALPPEEDPAPLLSPQSPAYRTLLKKLRAALQALAAEQQVPVELLAKRKQLDLWTQDLAAQRPLHLSEAWPEWRRLALQPRLAALQRDVGYPDALLQNALPQDA
ncbi:HRDC domain-containing protein [Marinospirillum sp. MEB164]|uniref:HRDC domain-containing protein n=1 Tax=Marinospirillum alkalitolerans TaxID=3123374 RepID=A0ABW8PUF1_9GAMM